MATTRDKEIAAASVLGEIAQEYIAKIPGGLVGAEIRKHIDLNQIGGIINDAAVKVVAAIDALPGEKAPAS